MDQELIAHLDQRFEEIKRHVGVLVEGIDRKVQRVAEGVTTVNEQLGRFREETTSEFRETQAMIRFSYADLQRQLQDLRDRLTIVEERLGLHP